MSGTISAAPAAPLALLVPCGCPPWAGEAALPSPCCWGGAQSPAGRGESPRPLPWGAQGPAGVTPWGIGVPWPIPVYPHSPVQPLHPLPSQPVDTGPINSQNGIRFPTKPEILYFCPRGEGELGSGSRRQAAQPQGQEWHLGWQAVTSDKACARLRCHLPALCPSPVSFCQVSPTCSSHPNDSSPSATLGATEPVPRARRAPQTSSKPPITDQAEFSSAHEAFWRRRGGI